jgi:hypothetical protein
MTFTDVWDDTFELAPTDNNYGYEIDNYIRRLQTAISERMAVDHIWKVGVTDGGHNKISLAYQAAKPTAAAGYGYVYTKDVGSGVIELFWEDADGNERQITENGRVLAEFLPIINSDRYDEYAIESYLSKNLDTLANPTSWRLFYVGANGDIGEIALSATVGLPLVAKGAAVVPAFDTITADAIPAGIIVAAAIADGAVTQAKLADDLIAGTTFTLATAATERDMTGTTPTKLKEITLNHGGTVTVAFSLKPAADGCIGYARIYKDGVAHGTEQHVDAYGEYETFTEALAFSGGDKIQLYAWTNGAGTQALVKDVTVKCGEERATVGTD